MRRITYTNWMSKIFKEITNGRGERVLENPAVQVLGAIFRKMNLDQNTIGAVSERLQNEKEKKDNIVKIIVAVVIIYLICYIIGGEVEWLAKNKRCRGFSMRDYIEERAVEIADYIIENSATVRQTAKQFRISKSTVHKDVTERLLQINPSLAQEARKVLDMNKSERHIRGGMATREKYLHQHLRQM